MTKDKYGRALHPLYYLKGEQGVFHGTTVDGVNCYTVSHRAKPLQWKNLKSVYKWLEEARFLDPTIEIVDASW